MILIDKLAYSSKLRYKSPNLKAFLAIGSLIICVVLSRLITSLIIILSMGILTVFIGKTPILRYLKLMLIPLFFLFLSTIAIIFNITNEPLDFFSFKVGFKYISVSYSSLLFAINLIITAIASVSCLYFLTLTTPIIDILNVLKKLHCPSIVVELMLLIYRYIFVLLNMSNSIQISQKCRLSTRSFKTSITAMGQMLSVLLVNSFKKASYLYDSMESRCFNGEINVLNESYRAKKIEIFMAVLFEMLLIGIELILKFKGDFS